MSGKKMDPRELEMLAIINMQPVPEDLKNKIHEIETGIVNLDVEPAAAEGEGEKKEVVEDNVEEDLLRPGRKIRPEMTQEDATKIAERLYGIVASSIIELNSYDDRNYLIQADK